MTGNGGSGGNSGGGDLGIPGLSFSGPSGGSTGGGRGALGVPGLNFNPMSDAQFKADYGHIERYQPKPMEYYLQQGNQQPNILENYSEARRNGETGNLAEHIIDQRRSELGGGQPTTPQQPQSLLQQRISSMTAPRQNAPPTTPAQPMGAIPRTNGKIDFQSMFRSRMRG